MADLVNLLKDAQSPDAGLDSSKLRGSTLQRLEHEGLVRIDKYHHTAGYLVAPAVVDELAQAARQLQAVQQEMTKAQPLMVAALRLGIDPRDVVAALVQDEGGQPRVDVRRLGDLIERTIDSLEAIDVARDRLAKDESGDVGLSELIASLGLDEQELRTEHEARTAAFTLSTR